MSFLLCLSFTHRCYYDDLTGEGAAGRTDGGRERVPVHLHYLKIMSIPERDMDRLGKYQGMTCAAIWHKHQKDVLAELVKKSKRTKGSTLDRNNQMKALASLVRLPRKKNSSSKKQKQTGNKNNKTKEVRAGESYASASIDRRSSLRGYTW